MSIIDRVQALTVHWSALAKYDLPSSEAAEKFAKTLIHALDEEVQE